MSNLDKSEIIADLVKVARALKVDELSIETYRKYGHIPINTIRNRFGSWKLALDAAGLKTASIKRGEIISENELLAEIISVTQQLNKIPSESELTAFGKFSIKPYRSRWGSFAKAREIAYSKFGFPLADKTIQSRVKKTTVKRTSAADMNLGVQSDFWNLIHPEIRKFAQSRFESGFYADAIENSLKEINKQVKQYVLKATGKELDGAGLMTTAFSINNPIIHLTELISESDRNIQQGYMQIFTGAMIGIRNPKAHDNVILTRNQAIHLLFLSSLLMEKLDEAGVLTANKLETHA